MPRKFVKRARAPKRKYVTKTQVNRMIATRRETKFFTTSYDEIAIQDSGRSPLSTELTNITSGDGQSQRTGHQVDVTGFYGKFVIGAGDTTNIVRLVICMPRVAATPLSGLSVIDLLDFDQYTVLYDRYHTVGTGNLQTKMIEIKRKFDFGTRKGISVHYSSGTGTDVTKNAIYLYAVSDSTAVADPIISGNLRLYYKD